jgi:hypothetical protein
VAEGLKRSILQKVAEARLIDAQALLANDRYSGAFYVAGYAVEIGLKACIARRMAAETIPDLTLIKATFTHSYNDLVGVAGLRAELKLEQSADALFAEYWGIAGSWSPNSRYDLVEAFSAQIFVQAVNDPNHGILRWIRQHW